MTRSNGSSANPTIRPWRGTSRIYATASTETTPFPGRTRKNCSPSQPRCLPRMPGKYWRRSTTGCCVTRAGFRTAASPGTPTAGCPRRGRCPGRNSARRAFSRSPWKSTTARGFTIRTYTVPPSANGLSTSSTTTKPPPKCRRCARSQRPICTTSSSNATTGSCPRPWRKRARSDATYLGTRPVPSGRGTAGRPRRYTRLLRWPRRTTWGSTGTGWPSTTARRVSPAPRQKFWRPHCSPTPAGGLFLDFAGKVA